MTRWILVPLLVLAMLVGCSSRTGAGEERTPQVPELSVGLQEVFDPDGASSISEVRRVLISASVIGVAGPRGVTLELLTPSGDVYERQVETLFGSAFEPQQVEFDLPVAGTFIDQSGLSGRWTALLHLGDEPVAVGTFELQP